MQVKNINRTLTLLLILAFASMLYSLSYFMRIDSWRHDALFYLGCPKDIVLQNGRWFVYLFARVIAFVTPKLFILCAYGSMIYFFYIASQTFLRRKQSLIIAFITVQAPFLTILLLWPNQLSIPCIMLAILAYFKDKYQLKYLFPLAGIAFFSIYSIHYFLIPLLFIDRMKSFKSTFKIIAWWILGFLIGYMAAQLMTYIIAGDFFKLGSWRFPNYVKDMESFLQNLNHVAETIKDQGEIILNHSGGLLLIPSVIYLILSKNIIRYKYQLISLVLISLSIYVSILPTGITISDRTAFVPWFAFIFFLAYESVEKNKSILSQINFIVLASVLLYSIPMANYTNLDWYLSLTKRYELELNEITKDLDRNQKIILYANESDLTPLAEEFDKDANSKHITGENIHQEVRLFPALRALDFKYVEFCTYRTSQRCIDLRKMIDDKTMRGFKSPSKFDRLNFEDSIIIYPRKYN